VDMRSKVRSQGAFARAPLTRSKNNDVHSLGPPD
jgi:hypothetical protein